MNGVLLGIKVSSSKDKEITKEQATKAGYRSIFEFCIARFLKSIKRKFRYEKIRVSWYHVQKRFYIPDFVLDNGIVIEVKGWFKQSDRMKHLAIKEQHPKLDIRFIFQNENNFLYKGSKTTYAKWCDKHKFKYANRVIPKNWLKEKGKDKYPHIIETDRKGVLK